MSVINSAHDAEKLGISHQESKSWQWPNLPVTELEVENSLLRKELADSRLENEITKKTMAYYAKELLPGTRRVVWVAGCNKTWKAGHNYSIGIERS